MKITPVYSSEDMEILEKVVLHQGFLNISRYTLRHHLYEGGVSEVFTREIMERPPGVGVLLYDPTLDKVVMIEQFRAGCLENKDGPWVLELVAGIVDTDESYSRVAIREAREEANAKISTLLPICEYFNSPGGSNERIIIMCAALDSSGLSGVHGLKEEHEDIKTVVMDRVTAQDAVKSGRINNAMSIIAIQWLQLNLQEVKAAFT